MIKIFSSALAAGALCAGAALAQSAPAPQPQDGGRHHQWMEAHKGDMAQFHARMCNDRYAHHVGMVAELGARLDLTEAQRPLFERWKTVALETAKSRETACASHQMGQMDHRPSLPEREAHMREMLKDRLAALDAQAPAMDALYASLTPQQKMELDHMGHRGGMGGMHGGFRGMHRGMGGMHGAPHPGGPDGEDQGI
jgi:LTXXQ motif family protein